MNYFVRRDLEAEATYMHKCHFMERVAFGQEKETAEPEMPEKDGPQLFKEISKEAIEIREKLDAARKNKDADELGSLIFDAECEDMAEMIDLSWYEKFQANLMEAFL